MENATSPSRAAFTLERSARENVVAVPPPETFEDFYRRQFRPLVGFLWAYCGDRVVAEEFAQEALARAARDWERVGVMASPSGWLHRVACNAANSYFRRRAAERRALQRHGVEDEYGPEPAVADAVAVQALPKRQRQVVALFYIADLPVSEVAEIVGAPENTVKSRLRRAREALRLALDERALCSIDEGGR